MAMPGIHPKRMHRLLDKAVNYGSGTIGKAANAPLFWNSSVVATIGVCVDVVTCIVPQKFAGRSGKSSVTNIAVWLLGGNVLVTDANGATPLVFRSSNVTVAAVELGLANATAVPDSTPPCSVFFTAMIDCRDSSAAAVTPAWPRLRPGSSLRASNVPSSQWRRR